MGLWFVGIAIFCGGLYLLYHITLGKHYGVAFGRFKEPRWFHFVLAFVV